MTNIEKRQIIRSRKLSSEAYFTWILQEAYACGLLYDSEIENLQMECIKFLAYKSERYNSGDSSSIRVEVAENIMKSNLYTIGLYLKSLPDGDCAVSELKTGKIPEMYQKGRDLINERLRTAKTIYRLVRKNRIATPNYTYNATLSADGIGSFFKLYNPDYEARETPASIDYQLCNPVDNLVGIEFIQKYLENLYLENEFCRYFAAEDIHHLLSGYDVGYKDLLINIFQQVLTGAIGCSLVKRSVVKLDVSRGDIQCLYNKLSEYNEDLLASEIRKAAGKVLEELDAVNPAVRRYVAKSLTGIIANITFAVKMDTLDKIFVAKVNPDLKPRIRFLSGTKMDNEDYRKFIGELSECRYLSDKLELIKEKIRSFGDMEDMLFDAQLSKEEIISVFGILGDIELAALIRRHPIMTDIQAVDLPEEEVKLRSYLKSYIVQLEAERQGRISEMVNNLVDD